MMNAARMFRKQVVILWLLLATIKLYGQRLYFPDSAWQIRTPQELMLNPAIIDSAVRFAVHNEVNMDTDLRVANLKVYAREPNYRILGPMKERGKPAGLVIKNGFIVAAWGDLNRVDMTFSAAKSYLSTVLAWQ
jgi:hypothetical protein